MKKIYKAPTTTCVKLRATNMVALSLNDTQQINSGNASSFEQNARSNTGWDIWGSNDEAE